MDIVSLLGGLHCDWAGLSFGGSYLRIFLSVDKVTAETMRYGNTYLYVDLAMYLFLGFIFVVRNCVQGIGLSRFILGAGTAELWPGWRCALLPAAFAGGEVTAAAPAISFYALCAADPAAWMAADAVLMIPLPAGYYEKMAVRAAVFSYPQGGEKISSYFGKTNVCNLRTYVLYYFLETDKGGRAMQEISQKARQVLEYLTQRESSIPPTVREIGAALRIKSTSTVHKYLTELATAGYIEKGR